MDCNYLQLFYINTNNDITNQFQNGLYIVSVCIKFCFHNLIKCTMMHTNLYKKPLIGIKDVQC